MKISFEWLNLRICLAFVLYVATGAALWMIENRMYAGAVETVFVYIAVYPPLFLIGFLVFGKRQMRKDRKEIRAKIMGMVGAMALVGCGIAAYNFLNGDNYQGLINWQLLAIVAAVAAVGMFDSKRVIVVNILQKVDYISLIFAALLLTTMIFLIITRPCTVAGAQRALSDYGYQDTHYLNHFTKEYEDLPDEA